MWAGLGFAAFAALALLDTRAWDSLITGVLQSFPSWPLYRASHALTEFGSVQLTGVLILWSAWAAGRRWGSRVACWIILPFLASLLLEILVKVLGPDIRAGVPVPPGGVVWAWFRVPTSHSFPSGHMLRATYAVGMFLAWEAVTRKSSRRPLAFWSLALIALAVFGTSQIYLGNHWASDVAGGFLLGASLALWASRHWMW